MRRLLVAFSLLGFAALACAQAAIAMRTHRIVDEQQGGLVLGTITVPARWNVKSRVVWTYADVSHPVRATLRAEAPDGSAWVEFFGSVRVG